MPSTTSPQTIDAIQLLSAVGDVFGGHDVGFSLHVARVAARFAAHRNDDPQTVGTIYYAAALHAIGAVDVLVARDASERDAEIAHWNEPAAGAALVASMGVFPEAVADAIRWHREAFDGTGFPDRLRWNGIPQTAMSINVTRAFVAALEAQADDGGSTADAVFTLVAGSGTVFTLAVMRDFRDFLAGSPDLEAPYEPPWTPAAADPLAIVAGVCARIDARQTRTYGRGDRIEQIVRAIVAQLGDASIDVERAVLAGRFTALARTSVDGITDDALSLSRLGRDARAAQARSAASILRTTAAFSGFAGIVEATEEWHDGSGSLQRTNREIDPLARIIAAALAAEAIPPIDVRSRIAAASGTRLDPAVVAAYLGAQAVR